MTNRIGDAVDAATATLTYLAGLPPATQTIIAVTTVVLLGYGEYRRRTRTTPTLRARAAQAAARAWEATRTPATPEQKDRRGDRVELLLVTFFVTVVAGLIMRGLVDFARDSMGLTGVWPYLLFAAFDGAAGLFAFASYRWALKHGASPLFPRMMVAVILAGSAWFQWTHAAAAGNPPAGQVAWASLPAIGAVLWEFVLRQRMKAWKKAQPTNTEAIPRARWVLAPVQSAAMKRRMVLWGIGSYDEAVDLHVTRVQCMRLLRREFGWRWTHLVPADVAYQLKAGVRIQEAAAKVPEIIDTHRREVENRRLVREAERAAKATKGVQPGTYTVSLPDSPAVDLTPVPGMPDVVEPLEDTTPAAVPSPGVPAVDPTPDPWVDRAAEWEPDHDEDEEFTDPWADQYAEANEPTTDPWDEDPFADRPAPNPGERTSKVVPVPTPNLDNWKIPVLPVVNGRQVTPKPGEPAFQDAVNMYLNSERRKKPLAGRELCRLNGVNPDNRLWRQAVIREAKAQQAATTTNGTPALFNV